MSRHEKESRAVPQPEGGDTVSSMMWPSPPNIIGHVRITHCILQKLL